MQHDAFKLEDAVAILERTPASLTALLAGLPERWVGATEGDGTWSPYDVIGHLIHGERTDWIPRARQILAGERRPFDAFDRTAQFTASQGKSVGELLATWVAHDLDHVGQIVRTMAKVYADAVGPWSAYLSILHDRE